MLNRIKTYYQEIKKYFQKKTEKKEDIVNKYKPYHKTLNTLPIANFDAILKTGNLNYLYKDDFFEINLKNEVPPAFYSLLADMIAEIPYVDNEKLRMEYQKEVYEFNYMVTGDKEQLNKFRRLESRLKSLNTGQTKESNLMEEVAQLEKHLELKLAIDIYTCPTSKYMAYRNMRKEQIKRLNAR